jgi:hypothetical protein
MLLLIGHFGYIKADSKNIFLKKKYMPNHLRSVDVLGKKQFYFSKKKNSSTLKIKYYLCVNCRSVIENAPAI